MVLLPLGRVRFCDLCRDRTSSLTNSIVSVEAVDTVDRCRSSPQAQASGAAKARSNSSGFVLHGGDGEGGGGEGQGGGGEGGGEGGGVSPVVVVL